MTVFDHLGKKKQHDSKTIVFKNQEPTFYDLRRAYEPCANDDRLIFFNNKVIQVSCNEKLCDHGITNDSLVTFMYRLGGSPLTVRLECYFNELFLCNKKEHQTRKILQNANLGHYFRCNCPNIYNIGYISSETCFAWFVEQGCYMPSQRSFNNKNICIWHVDTLNDNDTFMLMPMPMSIDLDIMFCNPKYDYDKAVPTHNKNIDERSRYASVFIKFNKYLLHETYELRFNRPYDLKSYFYITGFEGKQTDGNKMLCGATIRFVISNSSHEEYATEIYHVCRIGIKDIAKLTASYIF